VPQKLDDHDCGQEWYEQPSDWLEAIYVFDDRHEKTELCALLRSDRDLSSLDREHLLDLLDRYNFKNAKSADFLRSLDEVEMRGDADAELALSALVRARRGPAKAINHYVSRLQSDRGLSRNERSRLADFFEYYSVYKKKGKPRTPSYTIPYTELLLERAVKEMKELIKSGKSKEEALNLARGLQIPERDKKGNDPLLAAYEGRRASYRRALHRGRPLIA